MSGISGAIDDHRTISEAKIEDQKQLNLGPISQIDSNARSK